MGSIPLLGITLRRGLVIVLATLVVFFALVALALIVVSVLGVAFIRIVSKTVSRSGQPDGVAHWSS
jgi:hypothetical protein